MFAFFQAKSKKKRKKHANGQDKSLFFRFFLLFVVLSFLLFPCFSRLFFFCVFLDCADLLFVFSFFMFPFFKFVDS